MIRIDGAYLYNLGSRIKPIVEMSSTEENEEIRYLIFLAENSMKSLLQTQVFNLRTCVSSGRAFLTALEHASKKLSAEGAKLSSMDIWRLKQAGEKFENVLTSELGTTDLYYVVPKGSHRTVDLIEDGRAAFPDDLSDKVPKAVFDVQEATRCLAYERYTACGFHLHRANEAVLRIYWDVVTKGATRPKQENMGVYLSELKRRKKGSAKIRNILTEIKDMHRNPIIHPEHTLDQKDAMALMGVIHASITYMLKEIPAPPKNAMAKALAAGSPP
ncbi:MAG: hypothetical protein J0H65_08700 [Rhizobiales bacterium]|nr:hypothetical protein [Hyphomicrobiales bacterium]